MRIQQTWVSLIAEWIWKVYYSNFKKIAINVSLRICQPNLINARRQVLPMPYECHVFPKRMQKGWTNKYRKILFFHVNTLFYWVRIVILLAWLASVSAFDVYQHCFHLFFIILMSSKRDCFLAASTTSIRPGLIETFLASLFPPWAQFCIISRSSLTHLADVGCKLMFILLLLLQFE